MENVVKAIPEFLTGGGEMGERIRNYNWSSTPLGHPETWEQSLKTCVRIMLSSPQPVWIGWGKDLIKLYNDPYIDIVRGKHPRALGAPSAEVWKDIWKDIEPMLSAAMLQDKGTYVKSQLLIMHRSGYPEETYYTFSYTPVLGDDGKPAGIICYNTADTERIINERALTTLQQLGMFVQGESEQHVYDHVVRTLAANNKDFPFALIYSIDEGGKTASLMAAGGFQHAAYVPPAAIDMDAPANPYTNIAAAVAENKMVMFEDRGTYQGLPLGGWDRPPEQFVHIPIKAGNKKLPIAILMVGLNPYRKFDEAYRNFLQLIADQVSLGLNNAITFREERKRAQALEELDRAKTIFFSNISHEFRTPLTLMLGTIEEALHDADTTDRNKERMDITHRNALRLLKLVNTLLDFSRIESGRQKAGFVRTNATALTANLAGNFRSVVEKAGLTFTVETQEPDARFTSTIACGRRSFSTCFPMHSNILCREALHSASTPAIMRWCWRSKIRA